MKSQRMKARGGYEDAECLDQLQGIEQEMRRPVPSWVGQLVQELAFRAFRQPLQGQGRAQEVGAEMLQGLAGVSGHGDVGMKGEPLQPRAPGLVFVHHRGRRAQTARRVAGPRTGGEQLLEAEA